MEDDTREYRRERRRRRWRTPAEAHGAMLIGMLAIAFVFGNGNPIAAITLVVVTALFAVLSAINSTFGARLKQFSQTPTALSGSTMLVGALALTGVFGNAFLMALVILLAGLAIVFLAATSAAQTSEAASSATPFIPDIRPADPTPAALPAQAQGETISPLDVRELCRGLPPMQAGQVMNAVDYLEVAVTEAEKRGNSRAAYDARQALTDYLPSTVQAWKAQRPEDQDVSELDRALDEVRAIAGTTDGSAQRRAWETQQRFLKSRGPQETTSTSLEPGTGLERK